MLIYNGQIIAGGGTIVLPMTRAEYEANKAILDSADVWVDLIDEPDQVATAEQIAYSVDNVQKSMGYIGDIATKAVAKVEPTDTALYLHEVGEYFINKDGDACKVDLQIPVNGTITLGTNCHVLTKGVANDINSKLSEHTETSSTYTAPLSYVSVYCKNGTVVLTARLAGGTTSGWKTNLSTGISNEFKPPIDIEGIVSSNSAEDINKVQASINTNGIITVYVISTLTASVTMQFVYPYKV